MREMSSWTRPVPGSGRVLFPPDLDKRESLMGLVLKAASENNHSSVGSILLAAGYPHVRAFDLAMENLDRLPHLARILDADEDRLQQMTHPEVRSGKALRTITFLGAEVPDYDITTRRRRVSPASLVREPFHRACWNHGLLPYCPFSLELLVDTCPACGAPLGWYHADGINGCGTKDCSVNLLLCRPELLDGALAAAYRRMAALAAPLDSHDVPAKLSPSLAALNTGTVFELGWRLATIFELEAIPRLRAQSLPAHRIASILAVADDILTGWPTRFESKMDEFLLQRGTQAASGALKRLRGAALGSTGWSEISQILHATYPDLLRRGRGALRTLDPNIITGTVANSLIVMSTNRFATLKRAAALETVAEIGNERAHYDFDLGVVEAFALAKNGSISARSIAENLGISFHGVEQLIILGVLEEEQHPTLQAFSPQLRVKRHSLEALTDNLCSGSDCCVKDTVALRSVVKSLSGEKPWGEIVSAMLHKKISYHIDDGDARLFHRIRIHSAHVPLFLSMSFDRAEHPHFCFATDMAKRDVEEALNISPGRLLQALKEEIGSGASNGKVTVADVKRISREKISPGEICARISPGSRRLPRCLKRANFQRTGVAGWYRAEVEPLLEAM